MPNTEVEIVSISNTSAIDRVHVAVGVILNDRQEVLIAKRADHLHQGGLWEFPGGKVEKNETVKEALVRELSEELGIVVEQSAPFVKISYDYPDKAVLLDVWRVEKFTGQPQTNDSQPLCWIPIGKLKEYVFPQANYGIVSALESKYNVLPREIMITGNWDSRDDYISRLQNALNHHVKWVHLRSHTSTFDEYHTLYQLTDSLCKQHGAHVTVNTSLDWFQRLRASGLHFTTARLMSCVGRPVNKSVLFGASCHNLAEKKHAESINADYIMLGPVFKTMTHPNHEPIGLNKFSDWANQTLLPVYALGGVSAEMKGVITNAGAAGIAGVTTFWSVPPSSEEI